MRFIEQFEFLKMLHEDIAATWLVIEKSSGRRLLLHKCPKDSKLREQLLSMPPDQLIKLIAAGEDERFYFVVTHDLPELRRFRDWVGSGALSELAKATPQERAATESPKPGEFTRMFGTPVLPNETKPRVSEPPLLRDEPNPPKPGEFTRMFGTPVIPNEPKPPGSGAVLRNEPNSPQPGEFTRMFNTPVLPNEPKPSAAEPARKATEFTGIFGQPFTTASPGERFDAPPPLPSRPPDRPAGDFTRVFGSPNKGPAERPSTEHATGIFSQPKFPATPSIQPSEAAGPSEYTRIIRPPVETRTAQEAASQPVAPPADQAVTPEKTAPPESSTGKSKNLLPLVIILSLVVIAAIGLVVYFAVKR